jgi:hypothetical protein
LNGLEHGHTLCSNFNCDEDTAGARNISGGGSAGDGAGTAMKKCAKGAGYFLIALLPGMLFIVTCPAEVIPGAVGSIEGFGKLTWGISAEQAETRYPDLQFRGYEIENRKEEPAKIYYRRNAGPEKIHGVLFDSLEYGFKGSGFSFVRASLQSKIGPRTLVTRAETSWNQMADYLARKFGAPKERRNEYVTEYLVAVKEMRWETGGAFLRLNYNGAEGVNEDQLIFEIGKRPEGRP